MVVWIVLGVLLGVGLLVLLLSGIKASLRAKEQALHDRFASEDVVRTTARCNFFGIASRGMGQVRGNGALVLTRQALHFEMLLPKKVIVIPIDQITEVRTPRSFLGKSIGRKLLEISFRDDQGRTDSIAWWVADLDAWVADLSRVANVT